MDTIHILKRHTDVCRINASIAPSRTRHGPTTDSSQTRHGAATDPSRTRHGPVTDLSRIPHRPVTDPPRIPFTAFSDGSSRYSSFLISHGYYTRLGCITVPAVRPAGTVTTAQWSQLAVTSTRPVAHSNTGGLMRWSPLNKRRSNAGRTLE